MMDAIQVRMDEARRKRAKAQSEAGSGLEIGRFEVPAAGVEGLMAAFEQAGYIETGTDETGSILYNWEDPGYHEEGKYMAQILVGPNHDTPVLMTYGPVPAEVKALGLRKHTRAIVEATKKANAARTAKNNRYEKNLAALAPVVASAS
jgi:hypothetical protein